ncbi:MAG: DUF2986 domain-containing protein [Pseudomonadales bacterium]|nr:DUF2986 domain-containing protein [Pseudomonadales bacterium]
MNRQKKIKQIQNKRAKKAQAKLNPNKKSGYISKAERAKLDVASGDEQISQG